MSSPQLLRSGNPALSLSGADAPERGGTRQYNLQWFRYLLFGRAIPTAVFGCAAWFEVSTRVIPAIQEAVAHPEYGNIARAVQLTAYMIFAALPVFIYISRPAPKANDASLPARLVAFLAIAFLVILPSVGIPSGPVLYESQAVGSTIGAGLAVAAWAFAIAALMYLRHNLSVIPEARTLVTSGPYRRMRHPLYLAEIVAAIGGVMGGVRALSLLALGVLIALQIIRSFYEERLLSRVFPEYRRYAATTKRIVPGVW